MGIFGSKSDKKKISQLEQENKQNRKRIKQLENLCEEKDSFFMELMAGSRQDLCAKLFAGSG